jgi:hypothetical protein
MRALRRLRRLLQVSVGTLIAIFLACVFVPEAIDRLGPRSGLPNKGEGLLNKGRQDECLPTGVKGGEVRNVSVLVANGVNDNDYCEILGIMTFATAACT